MPNFRTPGSNVLQVALTVIGKDEFLHLKWIGQTQTPAKVMVQTYDPPVTVYGSIQAVDRKLYHRMGLNFDARYIQIWATQNVDDLDRYRPSDQIVWGGRLFNIYGEDDWSPIDNWNSMLAIDIGPYVP